MSLRLPHFMIMLKKLSCFADLKCLKSKTFAKMTKKRAKRESFQRLSQQ